MLKKILLASLIAASFGTIPLASVARTIVIQQAPPAPREEAVPTPRRGHTWAPGHWEWKRGQHVWVSGHWLRARRGQHWEADRWVERDGRWVMERGRWARGDRDGDGVPNRLDARPNNPNKS
ncbi:MAG: YXWGXW repeat-containing protein [Ramlibacter sp.]